MGTDRKINIPIPNADAPKYRSFAECGYCCGTRNAPTQKEDCFFFENVQDMGATIPTCSYYSQGFGFCPCENCEKYISNSTAYSIIKAEVETLPPAPQCPICGSRKHVIRVALNVEKGAPLIQKLFCNFCSNEWVDTISK